MISILHRNPEERRNLWISLTAAVLVHGIGLSLWVLAAAAMLSLNQALLADLNRAREKALQRAADRVPTVFVEVDPAQPAEAPPQDTPNYSFQNSRAANPDPGHAAVPRIDGKQEILPRTVDVLRPTPEPARPEPSAPEPSPARSEPQRASPPVQGDLTVAATEKPVSEAPRQKPGSLLEARMRQSGLLAGPKARQEGGVDRRGSIALDAKASPFGAYDATVIAAIQKRWYDLLDDSSLAPRSGKVVIEFTMHYDGRVTDIKILEQEVGEIFSLYCSKAISDPAPYPEWPSAMRQAIGRDHRDVRITFYYL